MGALARWIGAGAMMFALAAGAGERKLLGADEFPAGCFFIDFEWGNLL